MTMIHRFFLLLNIFSFTSSFSFTGKNALFRNSSHLPIVSAMSANLVEPSQRDQTYRTNVAQYLVDLHDNKATFDFCGGMMFQLMLTPKLRDHLAMVAKEESGNRQPVIADSSKSRMFHLQDYSKTAHADNVHMFHGRELRQIPHAEGGFGFVLQLSMADGDDPEGWSAEEVATYDGWGHDSGRTWRKADQYESEGFVNFKEKFGNKAFGLNHRFFLHLDGANRMWLSAEDGCEGTPAQVGGNPISRFFGL